MERLFFYLIAIIILVFSVMAVTSRNMMRSIIYLLFVLLGVAGIYFLLKYNFLAAVELAVYAGGIIVLYINSVMLIDKIGVPMDKPTGSRQLLAALLSIFGLGVSLFAIYSYHFNQVVTSNETTVNALGKQLLSYGNNGFVLPFELISIFLLAAMVGAIAIAKTTKSIK